MTPDPCTIRRARPEDATTVVAILAVHWPQLGTQSPGMTANYAHRLAEGSRIAWIMERGEAPVATAVVDLNDGVRPRTISTSDGPLRPDALLEKLVVVETARRHGAGRRLQEHAVAELARQGATQLALDVESDNPAALAFWTRNGWTHVTDERNPGTGEKYRHVCFRTTSVATDSARAREGHPR